MTLTLAEAQTMADQTFMDPRQDERCSSVITNA